MQGARLKVSACMYIVLLASNHPKTATEAFRQFASKIGNRHSQDLTNTAYKRINPTTV